MLAGCASLQKVRAGKILNQCKFSLSEWTFVSATLDSSLFPSANGQRKSPFPNAHIMNIAKDLLHGKTDVYLGTAMIQSKLLIENSSKDSLWIRGVSGKLSLDSILEATWRSDSTVKVAPGNTILTIDIQLPLDSKLFSIMKADTLKLEGVAKASFKPTSEPILLEFSQKRASPKAEIEKFANNAKKTCLMLC
jgi:hypothetical protein